MADRSLIDACFMWCQHKGVEPVKWSDRTDHALMSQAVLEYRGTFKELNRTQRRRIAGLHA